MVYILFLDMNFFVGKFCCKCLKLKQKKFRLEIRINLLVIEVVVTQIEPWSETHLGRKTSGDHAEPRKPRAWSHGRGATDGESVAARTPPQ